MAAHLIALFVMRVTHFTSTLILIVLSSLSVCPVIGQTIESKTNLQCEDKNLLVLAEDELFLPEIKLILDSMKFYPKGVSQCAEGKKYFNSVTLWNEVYLSESYGAELLKITEEMGISSQQVVESVRRGFGSENPTEQVLERADQLFKALKEFNTYLHIQIESVASANLVHVRMHYTEGIDFQSVDDLSLLKKQLFNEGTLYFGFVVDVTSEDYATLIELGLIRNIPDASTIPDFELQVEGIRGVYKPNDENEIKVEVGADLAIRAVHSQENLKYADKQWLLSSIVNPRTVEGFKTDGVQQNLKFTEPGEFEISVSFDDGVNLIVTRAIKIIALDIPELRIQNSQYSETDFFLEYETVTNSASFDSLILELSFERSPPEHHQLRNRTWQINIGPNQRSVLSLPKDSFLVRKEYLLSMRVIDPESKFRSERSLVDITRVPLKTVQPRIGFSKLGYKESGMPNGVTSFVELGSKVNLKGRYRGQIDLGVLMPVSIFNLDNKHVLNRELLADWGVMLGVQFCLCEFYNEFNRKIRPFYLKVFELDLHLTVNTLALRILDRSATEQGWKMKPVIMGGLDVEAVYERVLIFGISSGLGVGPNNVRALQWGFYLSSNLEYFRSPWDIRSIF